MPNGPKVLIIIPAFNEEESILRVVRMVKEHGFDYIVVNDGSTDKTRQICKENNINMLDLSANLGIGGAIQAGHKYARELDYDIDIQFDGDGQHDTEYLHSLIKEIEDGNDLAIGSRFVDKRKEGFKSTPMRRAGIQWLSALIRLLTGKRVTDPTSGFRACGKKAIDLFCSSYPTDYPEPESIVFALKNGLDVKEVPVSMNGRLGGDSSINLISSIYYMIKVTLSIVITGLSGKLDSRR